MAVTPIARALLLQRAAQPVLPEGNEMSECQLELMNAGKAHPRTCASCGLGPCHNSLAQQNVVTSAKVEPPSPQDPVPESHRHLGLQLAINELEYAVIGLCSRYSEGGKQRVSAAKRAILDMSAWRALPVSAKNEVSLTRDTRGVCVVTLDGREVIRDAGDVISHYATVRTGPDAP